MEESTTVTESVSFGKLWAPVTGRVIVNSVPSENNWLKGPVEIIRWKILEPDPRTTFLPTGPVAQ